MNQKKTLIVITGPTAVGKTSIAIDIAKFFNAEIVSADSRQFYREMSIGTAKPSEFELESVKHHFINSHSIFESFSAGEFETAALNLLEKLFQEKDIVLLVGGSGLFIKAVCEGFDSLPSADLSIRESLNNQYLNEGIEFLTKKLENIDPVYFDIVDKSNPQRLIRAIEVFESTGKPYSGFLTSAKNLRPFNIVKIGLNLPRAILYQRINDRVDLMVQQGLIKEVESLLEYRNLNSLNTVGYSELFNFFDGEYDLKSAIVLIKQNTRRFAKRQLTWFRKDEDITWIDANTSMHDLEIILNKLINNK